MSTKYEQIRLLREKGTGRFVSPKAVATEALEPSEAREDQEHGENVSTAPKTGFDRTAYQRLYMREWRKRRKRAALPQDD